MNENDFNEWYSQKGEESNKSVNPDTTKTQKKSDLSLEGKKLVQSKGCTACHTMDGSKSVGPTFKGLYGHTVAVISAGKEKTVVADEGYLKRSILDPHVELVKGYGPLMPEEKDFLKDDEISAIIAYIEELK